MEVINSKAQAIEFLKAKPVPAGGAVFVAVDFSGVTFDFPVNFSGCQFRGPVKFNRAVFEQSVSFERARFSGAAEISFESAEFRAKAAFDGAEFDTFAVFDRARFTGSCSFTAARLKGGARFLFTSFQDVSFFTAFCGGWGVFWHALFNQTANFAQFVVEAPSGIPDSSVLQINFSWAVFEKDAKFSAAQFLTPAYFWRTLFKGDVAFDFTEFGDKAVFGGRQTDVLFTRAGELSRPAIEALKRAGIFKEDLERQFGEHYMFTGIFSGQQLAERLDAFPPGTLTPAEKARIAEEWTRGALPMFADGSLVNFGGAMFRRLSESTFSYVNLDRARVAWDIGGSDESRAQFVKKVREYSADFFISHASEDKPLLAEPLARRLTECGQVVWIDRHQINYGDNLRALIDRGLENARIYVIIASKAFFGKEWTQYELGKILPRLEKVRVILHGITVEELKQRSPELGERLAFDFARHKGDIASLTHDLMKSAPPGREGQSPDQAVSSGQPTLMNTSENESKITPDQAAAHRFLTELRTRITTQPLPYQHGVEARALESMWEVFAQAREAIEANPGCEQFAARTTAILNLVVRPLTSKWHRAHEEGRLNGRDGADEFRGELQAVQLRLRQFAGELHEMAYGKLRKDEPTPQVMTDADLKQLLEPLPFGQALPKPEMQNDEAAAVAARREKLAITTRAGMDAIGLALSGGGIRSATFSLGVAQVLAEKGMLKDVDFLSTVSGGGYAGCFLTRRLGEGETQAAVAKPHGPDPDAVAYVRQHAQYLSGDLKEKWSMVTATIAGMLLNWSVPLVLILGLALVRSKITGPIPWSGILLGCGGLSALALVVYGWGMREDIRTSRKTGGILGVALALTGGVGLVWTLDSFFPDYLERIRDNWGMSSGLGAALAAIVAAVPGMLRFVPVLESPKVRKIALKLALLFAGVFVPFLAVVLFYTFCRLAEDHFNILAGITVALGIVAVFVININLTGPHRLYRECLARTFIQKSIKGTPNVKLAEINPQGTAPYHLINAALNIPSSREPTIKDRGCDFFLFSKNWMGSKATGYRATGEWKANGRAMDLATAMAVSGAAFSSYMGLGSMPTLTALLTLLNVRLGFWIKKPHTGGFKAPGFLCLLREMTGIQMSELQRWLNLSDGGHIENLAIYELLRRRCKFILCVDGESDPEYTFQGLMTIVRHAQIDFGVRISPRLDDLRPDAKTGYSKCHFHLCRIEYPEGTGLLLYLKLSVTGNESELIRRYRINNPDFPHQTTLDQFFDQEQFEAYRQLGVHVAETLFLPALMDKTKPTGIPDWFKQLAKNLLEPVN